MIVRNVARRNPRAVVFSGMSPGFDKAATLLKKEMPNLKIFAYYHGGISHFSFSKGLFGEGEKQALEKIINLHKKGIFKKIAVSYPGLAEVFRNSGVDAYFCGNVMPEIETFGVKPLSGLHIGNWNRHHDHKHTSLGIAIASLLGAHLHCLRGYADIPGIEHPNMTEYNEMSQSMLYRKYSEMTVCLQLSFIETFNISVLEMWACQTPVILGCGNYVLVEGNSYLEEMCYVKDFTNPVAIANQIKKVVSNRDRVVKEQLEHLKRLREQVTDRWEKFLL